MVTNQVTTNISGIMPAHCFQYNATSGGVGKSDFDGGGSGGGHLQAALGTKWAHCVNVRLVLERASADRRRLVVAKSPCCANVALDFKVTGRGVEEVEGSEGGPGGAEAAGIGGEDGEAGESSTRGMGNVLSRKIANMMEI